MNERKSLRILGLICSALVFLFGIMSCSKPGDLTVQRAMKACAVQNYDEAFSLFSQSLEEESNYHPEVIYSFISNLFILQGDIENSVIYAEKSLELRDDYRGYVTLGMNYHLLDNDEKAEKNYKKAIEMNPQKGEAYGSLGAMYLGQKKYPLAVENLKKATEFEPKIAIFHANLAIAYHFVNDFENSEKEFALAKEMKCENLEEFRARINSAE